MDHTQRQEHAARNIADVYTAHIRDERLRALGHQLMVGILLSPSSTERLFAAYDAVESMGTMSLDQVKQYYADRYLNPVEINGKRYANGEEYMRAQRGDILEEPEEDREVILKTWASVDRYADACTEIALALQGL